MIRQTLSSPRERSLSDRQGAPFVRHNVVARLRGEFRGEAHDLDTCNQVGLTTSHGTGIEVPYTSSLKMSFDSIAETTNEWFEEFSSEVSQGVTLESARELALLPGGFQASLEREVVAHEAEKVRSSLPFSGISVPTYDDTVSNGSVALILQGANLSEHDMRSILKGRGYPDFRIAGIIAKALNTLSYSSKGEGKVGGRVKAAKEIEEVLEPRAGTMRGLVPGCGAGKGRHYELTFDYRFEPHWKAKWPVPVKPMTWRTFEDRVSFRNWVNYTGWTLQKSLKSKKEYVTMNLACQTLFLLRSFNSGDPEKLLSESRVYVTSHGESTRVPRTMFLFEHLPSPVVSVLFGGVEYTSLEQWNELETIMSANKPLWRAGVSIFLGDAEKGDDIRLSAALLEKYPSRWVEFSGMRYTHATWPVVRGVVAPHSWSGVDAWLTYRRADRPPIVLSALEYQGIGDSVKEAVSNAGSSFGTGIAQGINQMIEEVKPGVALGAQITKGALDELSEFLSDNLGSFGIKLAAFAAALAVSATWSQRAAAIAQFCAGCDAARGMLTRAFTLATQGVEYQGEDDSPPEPQHPDARLGILGGIWETVCFELSKLNGFAAEALQSLLSSARWSFFAAVGKDLAESIIVGLKEFALRVRSCVKQGSINPLFGDAYNPERLVTYANTLRGHYATLIAMDNGHSTRKRVEDLVLAGLLPAEWVGPVDVGEYLIRARRLLGSMDEYISFYVVSHPHLVSVQQERAKLSGFISDLGCGPSTRRIVPFCTMLYGPPGTGKTNTMADLENGLLNKFHLERGSGAIGSFQPGFNFQSQLKSETRIFTFNDSDSMFPKPGEQSDVSFLMGLVDSQAFEVESAGVEMKGKVFANPATVLIATNNPTMRAEHKVTNPDAFFRRIHLRAKVLVREKFRVKGGDMIDPELVRAAGNPFNIREYYPQRWDGKKFVDLYDEPINDSEFYALYFAMFEEHYARQKQDLLRASQRTDNLCSVCHLPRDRGCGHEVEEEKQSDSVEYQGLFPTLSTLRGWVASAKSGLDQIRRWVALLAGKVVWAVTPFRASVDRAAALARSEAEHIRATLRRQLGTLWVMYGPFMKRLGYLLSGMSLAIYGYWRYHYQARLASAVEVKPGWVRADNNYVPSVLRNLSTWTYEEMEEGVRSSIMTAYNKSTGVAMHAICFKLGVVVVPKHLLRPKGEPITCSPAVLPVYGERVEFKFPDLPEVYSVVTSELNVRQLPHPELVCVCVPNLVSVRRAEKFVVSVVDVSLRSFDAFDLVRVDATQRAASAFAGSHLGTPNYFADLPTAHGDCGLPYVARFGSRFFMVGIHWAGAKAGSAENMAVCAPVACDDVNRISKMDFKLVHLQGMSVATSLLTKESQPETTGGFYRNSQVHVAITEGAPLHPLGILLNGPPGATPKSKIVNSLLQEDVYELFPEVRRGDFVTPDFKGRMVEVESPEGPYKRYESPITKGLEPRNDAPVDFLHLVAVWDYLFNMPECINPPVVPTMQTAVAGIPGTALHGANQGTSVGPPHVGPKSRFIDVVDEDGSVYFSPDLQKQVEEVREILARGEVPHATAVVTLKDEVLKAGKSPRVFFVLPAIFNLFMKVDLGPIREFMGRYPDFFECMVGINMVSIAQYNAFLAAFEAVPGNYVDLDAKHLDKVYKSLAYYVTALVFFAIAHNLGLDPDRSAQWLGSMSAAIIQQSKDLFMALFNLSGNDVTVQLNSIFQSISMRAIWYKRNPEILEQVRARVEAWFKDFVANPIPRYPGELSPFRERNVLRTYGDDMKLKTLMRLAGLAEEWLELNGVEITDANKGKEIVPKRLEETAFLKRSPRWDPELRCYVAPLDIKSIVKMLLFKKNKSMSDVDAMCDVVTNARRESALRPREELYDRLEPLVQKLAQIAPGNAYLDRRSYETLRLDLAEGRLVTWRVEDPVLPEFGFEIFYQGQEAGGPALESAPNFPSNMSSINIVEGGNDSAPDQVGVSHPALEMTTPTTAFASSTSAVVVPPAAAPKFYQQIQTAPLASFLSRPVRIHEWALGPSDVAGSFVGSAIDPWALFHQNPEVLKKTAAFLAMRGTTEVYAVVSIPGQCSGAYVLSAFPDPFEPVEPDSTMSSPVVADYPGNCMGVDHYARIDCSTSESVVMQLPFIYPKDYMRAAEIVSAPPAQMWRLRLTCLSPLRTAVVGGVPSGKVTIYANMCDDYDMVLPSYQGGYRERSPGLRPSDAMRTMAPSAYAKVSKIHERLKGSGIPGTEHGISGTLGGVAQAVGKLSGVPIIGPFAAAASGIGTVAANVMDMFGFTRRAVDPTPERSYIGTTSNVATVDSDDLSLVSGLSRSNAITIDPSVMGVGPDDQLSFSSIFEHWTVAGRFDWDPYAVSGTELWSLHVTPFWSPVGSLTGATGSVHLSAAGYVGLPFAYWRGSMEYLVVFAVSKLHRGAIQAYFIPEGGGPPGAADPTNTTHNIIYEVAAGEDLALRVGYCSPEPVLNSQVMCKDDAVAFTLGLDCLGRLCFRVVNPIQSQLGVAETPITVTVFQRACPDMRFFRLREAVMSYEDTLPTPLPLDGLEYQGGATGDEDQLSLKSHDLVPLPPPYPIKELLAGEEIVSARALMQKPSFMRLVSKAVTSDQTWLLPRFGLSGNTPTAAIRGDMVAAQPLCLGFHYRLLFAMVAGSERWKVLGPRQAWVGIGPIDSHLSASPYKVGALYPVTNSGPARGAEFLVPYYGIRKFFNGRRQYRASVIDPLRGRCNIMYAAPDLSTVNPPATWTPNVAWSFGPDIRAAVFGGVPLVRVVTTGPTRFEN